MVMFTAKVYNLVILWHYHHWTDWTAMNPIELHFFNVGNKKYRLSDRIESPLMQVEQKSHDASAELRYLSKVLVKYRMNANKANPDHECLTVHPMVHWHVGTLPHQHKANDSKHSDNRSFLQMDRNQSPRVDRRILDYEILKDQHLL